MAKVAIPVDKDCLSTYFGKCSHYALFTVEQSKIVAKTLVQPDASDPELIAGWFKNQGVTEVVTYKINHETLHSFIKNKINVFVGSAQVSPDLLIQDYLNGKLQSDISAFEM